MEKYNKLVRDRIPDIITESGKIPVCHTIESDEEFEVYLFKKMIEELRELIEDPSKEELADLLEVLYTFANLRGFDYDEIAQIMAEKCFTRGGFDDRIVLDFVVVGLGE